MKMIGFVSSFVGIAAGALILHCTEGILPPHNSSEPTAEAEPLHGWTFTKLWEGDLNGPNAESEVMSTDGYAEIAMLAKETSGTPYCISPNANWRLEDDDPWSAFGGGTMRMPPIAPQLKLISDVNSEASCVYHVTVLGVSPKT